MTVPRIFTHTTRWGDQPLVAPVIRVDQAVMQINTGAFCMSDKAITSSSPWTFHLEFPTTPTIAIWRFEPVDDANEAYAQHVLDEFRRPTLDPGSIGESVAEMYEVMVANVARYEQAYPNVGDRRAELAGLEFDLLILDVARQSMLDVIDGDAANFVPWGNAFIDPEDRFATDALSPLIAAYQAAKPGDPIVVMNHLFEWEILTQSIPVVEAHL